MRGRHRGEQRRRRRRGRPRSHNEAADGRAASTAVAPPPLPQDFALEPAVSARWQRREEGGGASRGRIRALAGLIGICGPNGTTDPPDCTLTDFPSSP